LAAWESVGAAGPLGFILFACGLVVASAASAQAPVRIAAWNIDTVGEPESIEYEASESAPEAGALTEFASTRHMRSERMVP
jgi:hypothetical protein